MEDKNQKITDQVTNRLDDLFGNDQEGSDPVGNASAEVEMEQQHFILEELNAIILSIEWEISDEIMGRLIAEIDSLKEAFRDDKIISAFLQLQGSLGRYIHKNKANAHPESIKLLHSIHTSLEKIATSPDMPESEKKATLAEKIKLYKDLKNQITATMQGKQSAVDTTPKNHVPRHSSAGDQEPRTHQTDTAGQTQSFPDSEMAAKFLEEIRNIIRDEFRKIKDEILSGK